MISDKYRVLDIVPGTTVDGTGLRTSVYFAGCKHHCPGCHNPESWNFEAGRELSTEEIIGVIEKNGFNVTFSGGDPLYLLPSLAPLAREIKSRGFGLWIYTGFRYEEALRLPGFTELSPYIDVLVDGPFEADKRDISLLFRGSANQRLIDVGATLRAGEVVLWTDAF